MANRLHRRSRTYGTMRRPSRSSGNMLVNDWDLSDRGPVWWVGASTGDGPYGPNGPWTAGMAVPASDRAQHLIVGPITSVWPWRLYRGAWLASDADPIPSPVWVTDPTLVEETQGIPAQQQYYLPHAWKKPGTRFWAEVLRDALLFGRGWFTYQENVDRSPVSGTFLNISPTRVDVEDDGTVTLDLGDDRDPVRTNRAGYFDLDGATWRLRHVIEPVGDGTGVMGRHSALLGLVTTVTRYTSSTFTSGVPAGYLKVATPNFDQTQADALKARWLENHSGRRSIAVLNATTEFHPIQFSPVDADLQKVDHMLAQKVAHAFNLSAWSLDAGTTGNDYANITDRRQDKTDDTLTLWKRALEQAVSPMLPRGTWLEIDPRGYLATDPAARMAYYRDGVQVGAFTAEYVQDFERVPVRYRPTSPQEGDNADTD